MIQLIIIVFFCSQKGKGDVKRGQLEPYSYIELDPKLLNKR